MNLSQIRAAKGVKVVELAKAIGVSSAAIYKWESGQRRPSFKNMASMAKYLNKSVDEIFFDIELDNSSNSMAITKDLKKYSKINQQDCT